MAQAPKLRLAADTVLLHPRDVDKLVPGVVELRAPAIAQVGGEILVACDARTAPVHADWEAIGGAMAADLPNPNSLVMIRNGVVEVLRRGAVRPQTGFSDPSLISDGETAVLFHARSADVGFFGSRPWRGDDARDTLHVDIGRSADGGLTWEFSTITGAVAGEYSGVFATSGHGLVVGSTWLQPAVMRLADGRTRHATWRSEDAGKTWSAGAACGYDCDESAIAYIGGRLVMSARSTAAFRSGALGRWWSVSEDLGLTWEQPHWSSEIPAAACNASLVDTPHGLACIYAEAGRIGGRIMLLDHTNQWREWAKLGTGRAFGYADALWAGDELVVVYESDGALRRVVAVAE